VQVKPLPNGFRAVPRRLWCNHPPLFPAGAPTKEDLQVAVALLEELADVDPQSFDWYGGEKTLADLRRLAYA
jgi:hypothetical protein